MPFRNSYGFALVSVLMSVPTSLDAAQVEKQRTKARAILEQSFSVADGFVSIEAGGERGHSMLLVRGDIEKTSESRSLAGARLLNDVSTVRDHRLKRFKGRKGPKRARRMCDVPEHRRVGVETG